MDARRSAVVASLWGLVAAIGCSDPEPPEGSGVHYSQCLRSPQPWAPRLDLLLVVDDSTAMAGFSDGLREGQRELGAELRRWTLRTEGASLHLGVVTTVLGTAPHAVDGCPATGHAGRLRTGVAGGPAGVTYVQDISPSGCTITRDATGCATHDCGPPHCEHVPGTTLVVDGESGCPRCRNYTGELPTVVADLATPPVTDCPFSQPLEAMKSALQSPDNAGFRRDDALLAVLIQAATDDCSAADPALFDPADAPLGPRTAFRCFEHGVTCATGGGAPGPRQDCVPQSDPSGVVASVDDYQAFLADLVEPQMLLVTGTMSPYPPGSITVELDGLGRPRLAPSCTGDGTATPSVRLHHFLSAFNVPEEMEWAISSICEPPFVPELFYLPDPPGHLLDPACFELPLLGCEAPGTTTCRVTDIQHAGLETESRTPLVPCLEVCPTGPCPGNSDPSQAFADGRPVARDHRLPVEACWYMTDQGCTDHSRVVVARQASAPPRTFVQACCALTPTADCP